MVGTGHLLAGDEAVQVLGKGWILMLRLQYKDTGEKCGNQSERQNPSTKENHNVELSHGKELAHSSWAGRR